MSVAIPVHVHLADIRRGLDRLEENALKAADWGSRLAPLLMSGARLLTAGNGGSAAQSQHLSAELVGRFAKDRPAYSALCLNSETSSLTAIANDYGHGELFARQVEAHARTGDVLLVLSTSGNSPNIVEAVRRARTIGISVWAMTGPLPNKVALEAEETIAVDAESTSTIQELHLVLIHVMCAAFDNSLDGRGNGVTA